MDAYEPNDELSGSQGAPRPESSANVQAGMAQMTDQLLAVIEAAERAATAIRYDAEEQGRHYLAEAQREADRLTAEVQDHSEQMVRALEEAITSVTSTLEQPALGGPRAQTEDEILLAHAGEMTFEEGAAVEGPGPIDDLPEMTRAEPEPSEPVLEEVPEPDPTPGPAAAEPALGWSDDKLLDPAEPSPPRLQVSDDALEYATDLAAAGEDRATIARALREEFGVAVPGPIVDRVLGPS